MIKLLAIDIDGTLLDSRGRVPEANVRAVADAHAAGVEVVLATGRRYEFARQVFETLEGPLTLILSNGAIVKRRDGTTLVRHLLPRDVAREVLARVPHRDGAAVTFDRPAEGQVVFESIDWNHPRHRRFFAANREYLGAVSPLEDCLTEDPVQVMFSGGCGEMRQVFDLLRAGACPERAQRVEAACPERAERVEAACPERAQRVEGYAVTLTEYLDRDFSLVDVLRAGCSKGAALREWAARQGVRPDDVMAIGDNHNDVDMLEFAGTAVVMGNACDELRGRGWRVTGTNDDCGLAQAVETFILTGAS